MEESIEELRPLTAEVLLRIWREVRAADCDETERGLLCNARVLAESCFGGGRTVFEDAGAVLAALTPRQMEDLLGRLADGGGKWISAGAGINPQFDERRYAALRGQ